MALAPVSLILLTACDGPQSALAPAGVAAERIADLFWYMLGGAVLIWLAVMGLTLYARRTPAGRHSPAVGRALIIGGGVMAPILVLGGLLGYGLALLPQLRGPAPSDALEVRVSGERWWWRVRYRPGTGQAVELANELRLPVGEPVSLRLVSPDVIHSFWVPSIGGKMDMIPGRENRLVLEPTRNGTFRGACAEYCGSAHALMSFVVVVMEKGEFDAWLARQRNPAQTPQTPLAEDGQALFLANGCGACHTIRGTPADGAIGPDLTHVGSRASLGAGILANDRAAFVRWIAHTGRVKPGVRMPAFGMLPEADLLALATYLDGLR